MTLSDRSPWVWSWRSKVGPACFELSHTTNVVQGMDLLIDNLMPLFEHRLSLIFAFCVVGILWAVLCWWAARVLCFCIRWSSIWRMRAWRAWRLPGRWPDGGRRSTVVRWTRRRAVTAYAPIPDLTWRFVPYDSACEIFSQAVAFSVFFSVYFPTLTFIFVRPQLGNKIRVTPFCKLLLSCGHTAHFGDGNTSLCAT